MTAQSKTALALVCAVMLALLSSALGDPAVGVTISNALIRFDTSAPGTLIGGPTAIAGLQAGENIVDIDVRPADRQLYGVGSHGRIYTINPITGAATFVAVLASDPSDLTNPFVALSGSEFGIDFNPVVDRLRIVSDLDQNLRVNVDTGLVTTDANLAFAVGDTNAADNPAVTANAYTNSFAGATSTTLCDIDFTNQVLALQNPPNNGTLNTVGMLPFNNAITISGFDIAPGSNRGFSAFTSTALPTSSFLYEINLTTGSAVAIAQIGPNGTGRVRGLALYPGSTIRLGNSNYTVAENAGSVAIPVFRIGSTAGAAQISYITAAGTATPGFDYQETAGVLSFANGENVKFIQVPIIYNATPEGDETFTVSISASSYTGTTSAVFSTPVTTTVTITDSLSATPGPADTLLYGVTLNNLLFRVNSSAPGSIIDSHTITGLQPGEHILGIDFRPATTELYGLGSSSRLYKIDPQSGAATQVGTAGAFTLNGVQFGFNFNPVPDRIRLVSNTGQNLRLNPNDGTLAATDTTLGYEPDTDAVGPDLGDVNAGASAFVAAVSYTNSDNRPASSTTLYDLDTNSNSLVIQNPPNTGVLNTVAPVNLGGVVYDLPPATCFEIAAGNTAFAVTTSSGTNTLFTVNLTSGQLLNLGTIDLPDGIRAIAVPLPSTLANISTRLRVEAGDNALIGGFIVTGTLPKRLIARAIGPSLPVAGALSDPVLEIYNGANDLIATNDNWHESANPQEVIDTGLAPTQAAEAAIVGSVGPGAYTMVVRGANGSTGVGLVEAYDLDRNAGGKLANISTRGFVQNGDNVMIGGFIVTGYAPKKLIARAIGPSLPVDGKLADPMLAIYDGNGDQIAANDNWKESQEGEINATGVAPTDDLESAIVGTVGPGAYTAILSGVSNSTGIGLVEVYEL